MEVSTLC